MFSSGSRRPMFWRLLYGLAIICATVGVLAALPQRTVSIAVAYTGGCLGGAFLFSRPFTGQSIYPRWVRIALLMVGPVLFGWGLVGFILLLASPRLSTNMSHILYYTRAVFEGVGLGILVLLAISGEFFTALSGAKSEK